MESSAARAPVPLKEARALAARALSLLERNPEALRLAVTGEVRRMEPVARRVDLLATAHAPEALLDALAEAHFVSATLERAPGKVLVRTKDGVALGLEVLGDESVFGAALVRTTGPDAHVAALHARARARGLSWDDDRLAGGPEPIGPEETDVYATLGVPWQPPEVRGTGDLEGFTSAGLLEMGHVLGVAGLHAGVGPGRYAAVELAARAAREGYAWGVILDGEPPLEGRQQPVADNPFVAFPGQALPIGATGDVARPRNDDDAVRIAYLSPEIARDLSSVTDLLVRAARSPRVDVVAMGFLGDAEPRAWALDPAPLLAACARADAALGIPPPHRGLPHLRRPSSGAGLLDQARARGTKLLLLAEAQDLNSVDDLILSVGQARRARVLRTQVLNTLDAPSFEAWRRGRRRRTEAP